MMAWFRIRPLAMSWPSELVALRIKLGLADEKMGSDRAFARELVHRMGDDVDAVNAELRELAAGVYPPMLAGGGGGGGPGAGGRRPVRGPALCRAALAGRRAR